jgi:enamine deaminase RidA (YjgF/YER057c/UK114 family)
MQKQSINPDTLATPVGHFDRAVRMGNTLWISGTSALTHMKGDVQDRRLPPSIEEQTRLTFENIKKVLDAAGGSLSDIFKLQVYIVRREDFGVIDQVTKEYLPDKGFINSAFITELLNPEMLIEIEASAWID